ncbi:MAG: cysteine--tRNA ligase [Balneolaceae bacterium]
MTDIDRFPIQIYNSLSGKKEQFIPINPPNVGLYVCGPTVYGDPHVGHARAAITFDVVLRYLRYSGYKVRYVRNITDVGHLEDEETEQGEDKIAKKARLEKVEPMQIVQHYTNSYHDGMDALNCIRPDIEPSATGHIIEQINLIIKIMNNGWAYEVDGNIYFDLAKYAKSENYGELSGKVLEELQSGSRDTEGMEHKKSPHDFALWKKATPGHIMKWDSPWGEGFPGWHLECTTMSTKYLGEQFDIHGGGLDLQFPHHEAEIAQNKAAFGIDPANYWMHNNMITIDNAKMSKSAGNFITLDDLFNGSHELLEKRYDPMVVRFLILQSHYRNKIDFSNDALKAAEKGFLRLLNAAKLLKDLDKTDTGISGEPDQQLNELCDNCFKTMSDDFNTAQTLAVLFEMSSFIHAFYNKQKDLKNVSEKTFHRFRETFNTFVFEILGLKAIYGNQSGKTEELVQLLIKIRSEAREKKDFTTSDKIRDELAAIGIILKDEKSGKTMFQIKDE